MCRRNSKQSEEFVAELVYRFLIPEIQKISVRERGGLYIHIENITKPIESWCCLWWIKGVANYVHDAYSIQWK